MEAMVVAIGGLSEGAMRTMSMLSVSSLTLKYLSALPDHWRMATFMAVMSTFTTQLDDCARRRGLRTDAAVPGMGVIG